MKYKIEFLRKTAYLVVKIEPIGSQGLIHTKLGLSIARNAMFQNHIGGAYYTKDGEIFFEKQIEWEQHKGTDFEALAQQLQGYFSRKIDSILRLHNALKVLEDADMVTASLTSKERIMDRASECMKIREGAEAKLDLPPKGKKCTIPPKGKRHTKPS